MTFPFFFPLPSLFSATAPVRPPAPTHCRTPPRPAPICRRAAGAVVALGAALVALSWAHARVATVPPPPALPPSAIAIDLPSLRTEARVGDLVFTRVAARPFAEVAEATGAWTNHVGVVVAVAGADVQVAESTVPFSRTTPLARFVARSEAGRVALRRLPEPLTPTQAQAVRHGAQRRLGVRYDTGFDLRSRAVLLALRPRGDAGGDGHRGGRGADVRCPPARPARRPPRVLACLVLRPHPLAARDGHAREPVDQRRARHGV